MIARFKDAGILCIPTVGAVKHAQKMEQLGCDMVTVQGGEGGGHTGAVPTTVLLPQVLDAVKIPVVAAGGFADGRGLAAALAYGAVRDRDGHALPDDGGKPGAGRVPRRPMSRRAPAISRSPPRSMAFRSG